MEVSRVSFVFVVWLLNFELNKNESISNIFVILFKSNGTTKKIVLELFDIFFFALSYKTEINDIISFINLILKYTSI